MTTLNPTRRPVPALGWPLNRERVEQLFVVLTLIGAVTGAVLERMDAAAPALLGVHLATYVFGGTFAAVAVVEALRARQIEVDLLMILAALGAAYVDAWTEGAILLFLFALSNVLQHYALRRTEQAIAALLELRPDTVVCREGDVLTRRPLDGVQPGAIMVLRPGDRVALDATIVQGAGSFDEASVTGESMPVMRQPGDTILAGTLNQTGAIDARVLRPAGQSTLARMIQMVAEARERKARAQSVLERFEQRYAVGVIVSVGLYIVLGPLLAGVEFGPHFYRAMTLLTVASPCALVIGVPAALLSAIAGAARQGVLFKGGAHLEDLSRVKVVAIDKTGTLTYGKPDVTDILPRPGVGADELLAVAARAEVPSEHPVARAIQAHAASKGLVLAEPEGFAALPGMGVRAEWDGVATLVGSPQLMERHGIAVPAELSDELHRLALAGRGAGMLVHHAGQWLGVITIMDQERPDAAAKMQALRAAGVKRVVMLTGDRRAVAEAVGARVGVDEVHAELLPGQKLALIGELQRRYGPTAMVGDGINDAPALAAADVGIAMGAAGTEVALETADVVLMRDDLGAIATAVNISRRARRVVRQNIAFALAVIVVMALSTLAIAVPLPLGVVSHEGSTLLVVLNGLTLLRRRG